MFSVDRWYNKAECQTQIYHLMRLLRIFIGTFVVWLSVYVSFVENSVTEDKANVQNIQNILIHVWCMNGNSHKNMKYRYDFPSICVFEYIHTIRMQSKCRTFKYFWFWCLQSFYAVTAAAPHWIIKSNEILKYNALRKSQWDFRLVHCNQAKRVAKSQRWKWFNWTFCLLNQRHCTLLSVSIACWQHFLSFSLRYLSFFISLYLSLSLSSPLSASLSLWICFAATVLWLHGI